MKRSKKVAIGGLISAISLVIMFLTGLFPFATMALPGIAGALLIIPVVEMGRKPALLIYAAVAILSIFITPDREAAVYYIGLLGYYPIIKSKLEQLPSRKLEYVLKVGLFSIVFVGAAAVLLITGIAFETINISILLSVYFLLLMVFVIYDFALSRMIAMYYKRIRSALSIIFR